MITGGFSMQIINGTEISKAIKEEVKQEVLQLNEQKVFPKLVVIIVGDNPASRVYVNSKKRTCTELGILSEEITLSADVTEEELLENIDTLNSDDSVSGILVQLPLPKHIDEDRVIGRIHPDKDVDGFHPYNVGKLMIGMDTLESCTPAGVIELLERSGIEIEGKHCVIVGRSNIVGKPVAQLLLQRNATVTICHSRTKDLKEVCKQADILVAAVGRLKMINREYVKSGAVIIDVGINRGEDGKLYGDVDFDDLKDVASAMTPVPGGVGPMTIAMLMKNTLKCAKAKSTLTE